MLHIAAIRIDVYFDGIVGIFLQLCPHILLRNAVADVTIDVQSIFFIVPALFVLLAKVKKHLHQQKDAKRPPYHSSALRSASLF